MTLEGRAQGAYFASAYSLLQKYPQCPSIVPVGLEGRHFAVYKRPSNMVIEKLTDVVDVRTGGTGTCHMHVKQRFHARAPFS